MAETVWSQLSAQRRVSGSSEPARVITTLVYGGVNTALNPELRGGVCVPLLNVGVGPGWGYCGLELPRRQFLYTMINDADTSIL